MIIFRALQTRVSERLAKKLLVEKETPDLRNFGNEVLVYGPDNEAPSIRTDLQPKRTQQSQVQQPKKSTKTANSIQIYRSVSEFSSFFSSASIILPIDSV